MAITQSGKHLAWIIVFLIIGFSSGSLYSECVLQCSSNRTVCEDYCYESCCSGGCGDPYDNCMDACDTGFDVCELNCKNIDEDGDGVSDFEDSAIGTAEDVEMEGYSSLQVEVGGYMANESNASNLTGVHDVRFIAEGGTILEFTQDFTSTGISLVDVSISRQVEYNKHGLVVNGVDSSKTMYIEKYKTDGALCVKDSEIDSIREISPDCDGVNEIFFGRCEDGETVGIYDCSVENGKYKISGLKHSGATEMNITGFYRGYFTVQYHTESPNHREGFLMPGESISICFESSRPIHSDENMRFIFSPRVGGLSINEIWTPNIINTHNVHIYP